ncbi:hypothetical protein [Streptomyces sp. NPDC048411]|uniref:hypothetical protein n=1 Tax=Streptomyces sp. NPDC048411 TaxID=3157206 RepID=UPI0034519D9C
MTATSAPPTAAAQHPTAARTTVRRVRALHEVPASTPAGRDSTRIGPRVVPVPAPAAVEHARPAT